MNKQVSKISVCLITYNHVRLIESTINSILKQSVTDFEFIVSDDCSNDGTWELLCALANSNSKIKAIKTPTNLGMPGNANYAIKNSKNPYVALLHHDDIYKLDLLEKWALVLEKYEDVSFVFNPYGVYESDVICSEPIPEGRIDGKWLLETYLLPRWGCVVRGTAMIRRICFDGVGGLNESYGLLADVDLWMKLSMKYAVGYVNEPLIIVRQERPNYYPDIYKENHWSWKRHRILLEIHGANHMAYYDLSTLSGKIKWFKFTFRLSNETAKWLIYSIVKRKWFMLDTSLESKTKYDQIWLRCLRNVLYSLRKICNPRNELT